MVYTVNKLAKLSGISARTLRFYDEIGLLKPAYVGDNDYRYYEEEQLLMLQQILFYRELDFPLSEIQRIINSDTFDKIESLQSHKRILEQGIDRFKQMIKTIDKTISHLKGNETMKLEEIFHGFNAEKQKLYEDFLVDSGISQNVINKSKDKVKKLTKEQWVELKQQGDTIHADLVAAINQDLGPSSPEVQKIVKNHYQMTMVFWAPNRESYIGLSQLYSSHPDFVKFYENIHPKLLPFLAESMRIFAERELS